MHEPEPVSPDILERLSRLESQVAWLTKQVNPAAAQEASRQTGPIAIGLPPPPRPLPAPPRPIPPRKPMNPIVWVAAVGSFLFLVGAAYFLHWSIQQGWIGPELRFLLGLLVGGGLSFGSARLLLGHSPKLGAVLLLAGLGTLLFTFRWGAFEYHFYPPALGLVATFVCTLLAGGLSVRAKSGASLSVALIAGLLAPLVFSQGGHHEVGLALYLAVLMGAALAVPYLGNIGARWGLPRVLAVFGTWIFLAAAALNVPSGDAGTLFLLLLLHLLITGLWIWLPGQAEAKPSMATPLWLLVSLAATSLAWVLWKELHWIQEGFAGPVLVIAALNLALVKPLRIRLDGRSADLGLLVLAAGHLALAVPVALAWHWVGPVWGLFALGLAWSVGEAEQRPEWNAQSVRTLTWMALGMAIAATLRWLVHGLDVWDFWYYPGLSRTTMMPFFNNRFAEGALAAAAWGLLARRQGFTRVLGFLGLEFVGGLTLSLELAHLMRWLDGTSRGASVTVTLAWAVFGALQWLRSLSETRNDLRRALAIAGYGWLGLASLKLISLDLDHADVPTKALAFLGVGAVIITAALVGNKLRVARKEAE